MKHFFAPLLFLLHLLSAVFAEEPPAAPILRIEAGMHTAPIKSMATDKAGRIALTASEDKTARLWELPSGRLLRVLRPPIDNGNEGKLFACALSADGTLAAMGGFTGKDENIINCSIYLFDPASGQMLRRLEGMPNVIQDLAFSPDGLHLAASLAKGEGVRVFDVPSGREIAHDMFGYRGHTGGVEWSRDGRLLTTCGDGYLRIYEAGKFPASPPEDGSISLTPSVKALATGGKLPKAARFSPDGSRIAVGFHDATAVAVHDGRDLSFLFAPFTNDITNVITSKMGVDAARIYSINLMTVTWSPNGNQLFAGGGGWAPEGEERTPIRRWEQGGKGVPQDRPIALGGLWSLRLLPTGNILFCATDPLWGMLSADGKVSILGLPATADFRGEAVGFGFLVSDDASTVGFGFQNLGKQPVCFSVGERTLKTLKDGEVPGGLHAPKTSGLPVTDWVNTSVPKLNGQPLEMRQQSTARSLAIAPDDSFFLVGAGGYLHCFAPDGRLRWVAPAPGQTWQVNLSADGTLAVAGYADGTIRWHRTDNGRELLAFFPHADLKRWVLWTPDGYYDNSPNGGEELLGWHVNRGKDQAADFFPVAKHREKLHRPDVINLVLQTLDVAEAVKQADAKAGVRAGEPEKK